MLKRILAAIGTKVRFPDLNWAAAIPEGTAIVFSGPTRETQDTTTADAIPDAHGVYWRTKEPLPLANAGTVEFTIVYHPETLPPWRDVVESVSIEFPIEKGKIKKARLEFAGFIVSAPSDLPFTGQATSRITVEVSGNFALIPSE